MNTQVETAVSVRLKELRKVLGCTQSALASDAGINQPELNALENGKRPMIVRLAVALEIGAKKLYGALQEKPELDLELFTAEALMRLQCEEDIAFERQKQGA